MLKLEVNIAASYRATFEGAAREMQEVAEQKVKVTGGKGLESYPSLAPCKERIEEVLKKLEAKKESEKTWYPEVIEEISRAYGVIRTISEAMEADAAINGDTPLGRKVRYSCPGSTSIEGLEAAVDTLFLPALKRLKHRINESIIKLEPWSTPASSSSSASSSASASLDHGGGRGQGGALGFVTSRAEMVPGDLYGLRDLLQVVEA
jgi:hypothetical protein